VDSLGGWCGSTVAEDADIGYRAQFERWEYVFLRHVVSLSELSESMDAIRIQRHRWARGLIHNAFKHLSSFLAAGMPLMKRLHAFSLIFSSLLLASIYGLVLLSLPMAIYSQHLGMYFDVIAMLFLLGVVVWIGTNFTGAKATSGEAIGNSFFSKVLGMLMYVSMFFPLSLYYFYAGIELLFTKEYEFKRTPKGGLLELNEKYELSKILSSLEWFSFVYSLVALVLGVVYRSYWVILFKQDRNLYFVIYLFIYFMCI
jgi:cellulose synthase (UDP-forming)